jgi:hypothetical protein
MNWQQRVAPESTKSKPGMAGTAPRGGPGSGQKAEA